MIARVLLPLTFGLLLLVAWQVIVLQIEMPEGLFKAFC